MSHRRDRTRHALRLTSALAGTLMAMPSAAQIVPVPTDLGGATTALINDGFTRTIDLGGASRVVVWNGGFVLGSSSSSTERVQFTAGGVAPIGVLNRITGGSGTQIFGAIASDPNVRVWLSDPNGITFGATGSFSGGSLALTTKDMSGPNFLLGGAQTLNDNSGAGVTLIGGTGSGTITGAGGLLIVAPVISVGKTVAMDGDVTLVAARDVVVPFDFGSPLGVVRITQGTTVGSATLTASGGISGANVRLFGVAQDPRQFLLNVTSPDLRATANNGKVVLAAGTEPAGSGLELSGVTAGQSAIAITGTIGGSSSGNGDVIVSARDDVDGTGRISAGSTGGTLTLSTAAGSIAGGLRLAAAAGAVTIAAPGAPITLDSVTSRQAISIATSGILTLGAVSSTASSVTLSGDAGLRVSGALAAASDVALTSTESVAVTGGVNAGGNLNLAAKGIALGGELQAAGAATLTAGSDGFTAASGTILRSNRDGVDDTLNVRALSVAATGAGIALANARLDGGDARQSRVSVAVSGANRDVTLGPVAAAGLDITGSVRNLTLGNTVLTGAATLAATQTVTLADATVTAGGLTLSGAAILVDGALSAAGGSIMATASTGSLDVRGLAATGDVTLTATAGTVFARGAVTAGGDYRASGATVTIGSNVLQQAAGTVVLAAGSGTLGGGGNTIIRSNSGNAPDSGDSRQLRLGIGAGQINLAARLEGGTGRQSRLALAADDPDRSVSLGDIAARSIAAVGPGTIGDLTLGNAALTEATSLNVTGDLALGGLSVSAGGLTLGAASITASGPLAADAGDLEVTAAGTLDIGTAGAAGAVTLTATAGTLFARGPVLAASGDYRATAHNVVIGDNVVQQADGTIVLRSTNGTITGGAGATIIANRSGVAAAGLDRQLLIDAGGAGAGIDVAASLRGGTQRQSVVNIIAPVGASVVVNDIAARSLLASIFDTFRTGALTVTDALTLSAAGTLDVASASSAGAITLGTALDTPAVVRVRGAVTAGADYDVRAGRIELRNGLQQATGALTLTSVSGSIDLVGGGALTLRSNRDGTAPPGTAGLALSSASGMALGNAVLQGGPARQSAVTMSASGNIALASVQGASFGAVSAGSVTLTADSRTGGDFVVSASGTGNSISTRGITSDSGRIDLESTAAEVSASGTLAAAGAVRIRSGATARLTSITAGAALDAQGGAIIIAPGAALSAGAAVRLATTGGSISGGDGVNITSNSGGLADLTDVSTLTLRTVGGGIDLAGANLRAGPARQSLAILDSEAGIAFGSLAARGLSLVQVGDLTFDDIMVSDGLSLRATAGNIAAGNATSTGGAVLIEALAGNIVTRSGTSVSAGGDVTLRAAAGSVSALGSVAAGTSDPLGAYLAAARAIVLGTGVTQQAGGAVTMTATAGAVTGGANSTVRANSGGVAGGTRPLTISATGDIVLADTVLAAAAPAVAAADDVIVSGAAISLGAVGAARDIVVNAGAGLTLASTLAAGGNVLLTAGATAVATGNVTAGQRLATGRYALTGAGLTLGSGRQQAAAGIRLQSTGAGNAIIGSLTLLSDSDGDGDGNLLLRSAGGIALGTAVLRGGTARSATVAVGDAATSLTLGRIEALSLQGLDGVSDVVGAFGAPRALSVAGNATLAGPVVVTDSLRLAATGALTTGAVTVTGDGAGGAESLSLGASGPSGILTANGPLRSEGLVELRSTLGMVIGEIVSTAGSIDLRAAAGTVSGGIAEAGFGGTSIGTLGGVGLADLTGLSSGAAVAALVGQGDLTINAGDLQLGRAESIGGALRLVATRLTGLAPNFAVPVIAGPNLSAPAGGISVVSTGSGTDGVVQLGSVTAGGPVSISAARASVGSATSSGGLLQINAGLGLRLGSGNAGQFLLSGPINAPSGTGTTLVAARSINTETTGGALVIASAGAGTDVRLAKTGGDGGLTVDSVEAGLAGGNAGAIVLASNDALTAGTLVSGTMGFSASGSDIAVNGCLVGGSCVVSLASATARLGAITIGTGNGGISVIDAVAATGLTVTQAGMGTISATSLLAGRADDAGAISLIASGDAVIGTIESGLSGFRSVGSDVAITARRANLDTVRARLGGISVTTTGGDMRFGSGPQAAGSITLTQAGTGGLTAPSLEAGLAGGNDGAVRIRGEGDITVGAITGGQGSWLAAGNDVDIDGRVLQLGDIAARRGGVVLAATGDLGVSRIEAATSVAIAQTGPGIVAIGPIDAGLAGMPGDISVSTGASLRIAPIVGGTGNVSLASGGDISGLALAPSDPDTDGPAPRFARLAVTGTGGRDVATLALAAAGLVQAGPLEAAGSIVLSAGGIADVAGPVAAGLTASGAAGRYSVTGGSVRLGSAGQSAGGAILIRATSPGGTGIVAAPGLVLMADRTGAGGANSLVADSAGALALAGTRLLGGPEAAPTAPVGIAAAPGQTLQLGDVVGTRLGGVIGDAAAPGLFHAGSLVADNVRVQDDLALTLTGADAQFIGGMVSGSNGIDLVAGSRIAAGSITAGAGLSILADMVEIGQAGSGGNLAISSRVGSLDIGTGTAGGTARLAAAGSILLGLLESSGDQTLIGSTLSGPGPGDGSGPLPALGRSRLTANGRVSISVADTAQLDAVRGNMVVINAGRLDISSADGGTDTLTLATSSSGLTLGTGRSDGAARLASATDLTMGTLTAGSVDAAAAGTLSADRLSAAEAIAARSGRLTLGTATAGTTISLSSTTGDLALTDGTAGADAVFRSAAELNVGTLTAGAIDMAATGGVVAHRAVAAGAITAQGSAVSLDFVRAGTALTLASTTGRLALLDGTAGGDAALTAAGELVAGSAVAAGALTARGSSVAIDVAQSGTTLTVGSTSGDLVLSDGASGGDAVLTALGGLVAGRAVAGGALTARGTSVAIDVARIGTTLALATTSGPLHLSDGVAGGTATLAGAGDLTIGSLAAAGIDAVAAGAFRAVTLTAQGDVSARGTALTVGRVEGSALVLNSTGGALAVSEARADTTARLSAAGDLQLDTLTAGGNADLAATGNLSGTAQSGPPGTDPLPGFGRATIVGAGTTTVTAGAAAQIATVDGRTVTIIAARSDVDSATASGGDLTVNGDTIGLGSGSAGGDLRLAGSSMLRAGTLRAGGAVTATADSFDINSITAAREIGLTAARGNGRLGDGAATDGARLAASATLAGGQVSAGGALAVTAGQDVGFDRLTAGGAVSVTAQSGQLQLGAVRGGGDVMLRSGRGLATGEVLSSGGTITAVADAGGIGGASAGPARFTTQASGRTISLSAAGGTLDIAGAATSNGNVELAAADLALAGPVTAGTATIRLRAATPGGRIGLGENAPGSGGMQLSQAEVNRLDADTVLIDAVGAGTGVSIGIGNVALDADTGRTRLAVLTTGTIDIAGRIGDAGTATARTLQLGGTATAIPSAAEITSGTVLATRIEGRVDASGAITLPAATLDLRAGRVLFGSATLRDTARALDGDAIARQFVANPGSSLYTGLGLSTRQTTFLTANLLRVIYRDAALFQNTGSLGSPIGSALGTGNPPLSIASLALELRSSGDTPANGFALFGTINGFVTRTAGLLPATVIDIADGSGGGRVVRVTQGNSRINGCVIGSPDRGCLIVDVPPPTLRLFDERQITLFGAGDDLSLPFEPLVGGTNETLIGDISVTGGIEGTERP